MQQPYTDSPSPSGPAPELTIPSPSSRSSSRRRKRSTRSPDPAASIRVSKAPRMAERGHSSSATPRPLSVRGLPGRDRGHSPQDQADDELSELLGSSLLTASSDHHDKMQDEKQLFPGSASWAEDEVKLFEILYMREYWPLLPSHWSVDFHGIPVPEMLFATSEVQEPVVFSHSGNDFKATTALVRMVNLTSNVRTLIQTGQRDKVSSAIRRELEEYAKWAAQDGGYDSIDIVPNLIINAVDISESSDQIEQYMQTQMRSLAAKHRDYWRIERLGDDEARKQSELASKAITPGADPSSSSSFTGTKQRKSLGLSAENTQAADGTGFASHPQLSSGNPAARETPVSPLPAAHGARELDETPEKGPLVKREGIDGLLEMLDLAFTQRPPVIYGMFVVHHSVLILSIDSSKEGFDAYVSYQVESSFNAKHQGVWNAITMAIVICLARDRMITMANDFVQLVGCPDSDPDA